MVSHFLWISLLRLAFDLCSILRNQVTRCFFSRFSHLSADAINIWVVPLDHYQRSKFPLIFLCVWLLCVVSLLNCLIFSCCFSLKVKVVFCFVLFLTLPILTPVLRVKFSISQWHLIRLAARDSVPFWADVNFLKWWWGASRGKVHEVVTTPRLPVPV